MSANYEPGSAIGVPADVAPAALAANDRRGAAFADVMAAYALPRRAAGRRARIKAAKRALAAATAELDRLVV